MSDYILVHHGIKGQRWGVRRFQNLDGTLTSAGKRRYNVDISGAEKRLTNAVAANKKAIDSYNNISLYDAINSPDKVTAAQKKINTTAYQTQWAKKDLKDEKIKQKLNNEESISKHRQKLEQYYKEKGMNDEEAAIAAYKRARVEKALAVTAGVTITAAAAYVAKNQYDARVDKVLNSGDILKRVASSSDASVHDGFYATLGANKGDGNKYVGMYGRQIQAQNGLFAPSPKVYEKEIGLNSPIKIASRKNSEKIVGEMLQNDKEFKVAAHKTLEEWKKEQTIAGGGNTRLFKKAISDLEKGKMSTSVWDALNMSMVDRRTDESNLVRDRIYDTFKQKGYGAIADRNDQKYSGYNTKLPIIVFDSGNAVVKNVREVGQAEINKKFNKEMGKVALRSIVQTNAPIVGMYGAAVGVGAFTRKANDDKIVREYIKEHPNTNMGYNEILRKQQLGKL